MAVTVTCPQAQKFQETILIHNNNLITISLIQHFNSFERTPARISHSWMNQRAAINSVGPGK